jgi:hypothetical protein
LAAAGAQQPGRQHDGSQQPGSQHAGAQQDGGQQDGSQHVVPGVFAGPPSDRQRNQGRTVEKIVFMWVGPWLGRRLMSARASVRADGKRFPNTIRALR